MVVVKRLSSSTWKWLVTAALLRVGEVLITTAGAGGGVGGRGGKWELLLNSSGVVAMHMALTHHDTVVIFDQTRSGPSGYPHRRSRHHPHHWCNSDEDPTDHRCYAHSVEYHAPTNTIRPLTLQTDTWCSSGSFLGDGTLLQTGGHGGGSRKIRYFRPCSNNSCDWIESDTPLKEDRWYASDQVLPEEEGRLIVVGGLNAFTYEFVPNPGGRGGGGGRRAFELPFLRRTRNRREEGDNLYPFLHLSSDGNLFIFANRDSVLLDYKHHRVVRTFPPIPGSGSRSYPSTGSSVMLPLDHADGFNKVEIMVCGGAADGAYRAARRRRFLEALSSCGRMVITGKNPKWEMEDMPGPRLLNDMLILPAGDVLIINGATHGCAGWQKARNPSYSPYLYKPKKRAGRRFSVLNPSAIARLYHSSAIVLADGRVLVAGSNPNRRYAFSGVRFPTELRVEAFVPHHMGRAYDSRRASNLSLDHVGHGNLGVKYGEEFRVRFQLKRRVHDEVGVGVHVYAPPFATHSLSMNQRMLRLRCHGTVREEGGGLQYRALVQAPPSPNVAPSGYYLLTVVHEGIPSKAIWVRFVHA